MDLDFLEQEQYWLAKKIHIPKKQEAFSPTDVIFGIDVQYAGEEAYVAITAYDMTGRYLHSYVHKSIAGMKYKPGFFCFREGPPVLRSIRKVLSRFNIIPQVILIDGHGLAHPRQFGIACFVGLHTNIPTIGVAKQALLNSYDDVSPDRGAIGQCTLHKKVVGVALRTQKNTHPIYVSPGYKISLDQSIDVIKTLSKKSRLPEPINRADRLARAFANGKYLKDIHIIR